MEPEEVTINCCRSQNGHDEGDLREVGLGITTFTARGVKHSESADT